MKAHTRLTPRAPQDFARSKAFSGLEITVLRVDHQILLKSLGEVSTIGNSLILDLESLAPSSAFSDHTPTSTSRKDMDPVLPLGAHFRSLGFGEHHGIDPPSPVYAILRPSKPLRTPCAATSSGPAPGSSPPRSC